MSAWPLVASLQRLRDMRGWSSATLARQAGVAPATVFGLAEGRRRGLRVDTADALARAMDARLVVVPDDLSRADHVALVVDQLGLSRPRAFLVRRCLLAAWRPVDRLPVPSPAGVRKSRSFVE